VLGVEIGVVAEDSGLDVGGEHAQAAEVVVAVAFDVGDAEGGADGEVLEQRDGADVGEVFAGEDLAGFLAE